MLLENYFTESSIERFRIYPQMATKIVNYDHNMTIYLRKR